MAQNRLVPGAEPDKEKLIPVKGSDGKWRLTEVRHRTFSGTIVRSSGTGRTKSECLKDFWQAWERNRRKGTKRKRVTTRDNAPLTLQSKMSDAFALFKNHAEQKHKQGKITHRTLTAYMQAIYPSDAKTWRVKEDVIRLDTEMGNLSISEASQVWFLTDYLADVAEERPGVAAAQAGVLSGVFQMLTTMGLFEFSPMKLVTRPSSQGGQQRALNPAERHELYRMLCAHRRNPRAARWLMPLTLFVLGTGVRPGEAAAIRWTDISGLDNEYAVVSIEATIVTETGQPAYRQPNRKAGQSYYVTLPKWLTAAMREWRDYRQPTDPYAMVFTARNGGRNSGIVDPTTAEDRLRYLRAGTSLEWVTFGNLRDTAATEVRGRTGDARRASAQLGHTEGSSMALRHYIDPNGYVRHVVDNAEALEWLNPQNSGKVTEWSFSGVVKAA
ncbi:site-specific integrase [Nocardia brasiliensis]|uniref:site-specific integrase n=1 Tax=Nocardia brasiliensis TaxID=37326 RepID=UPI002457C27F|nr:site-specific integrase [Nocardia brasiliensis]